MIIGQDHLLCQVVRKCLKDFYFSWDATRNYGYYLIWHEIKVPERKVILSDGGTPPYLVSRVATPMREARTLLSITGWVHISIKCWKIFEALILIWYCLVHRIFLTWRWE